MPSFDFPQSLMYNASIPIKEAMFLKSSSDQRVGYYPGSPAPQKPKKPRRVFPFRLVMLVVCICVFAVSAGLLIRYFSNIAASRKASRQMEEIYAAAVEEIPSPTASPTATPEPAQTPALSAVKQTAQPKPTSLPTVQELWPSRYPGNPTLRVSSAFYQLQQQNPDIIGWLKIDGVVDEPVLQRDNSYYLTHNALKQRSVTGALFLDESCDLKTVPTQMVVHGHNMKEGAMFGALKKYKVKDASFYKANPFIEFNTMYENGRYVIFAVCEVDIRPGKYDHLPFWYQTRFSSVSAFEEYVRSARTLSQYRCNVDVVPGDRLLTLATCTGTDENKRLVILSRRIRDGENELELQMDILTTSDR